MSHNICKVVCKSQCPHKFVNLSFTITYLAESVCKVVLKRSIPAQIRQLILDSINKKG